MDRTSKRIEKCFIPNCKNTTKNSRHKLFLYVREEMKRRWCSVANLVYTPGRRLLCCEDHVNLQEALENYQKYKIMGSRPILKLNAELLINNAVPSTLPENEHRRPNSQECQLPDNQSILTDYPTLKSLLEESNISQSQKLCVSTPTLPYYPTLKASKTSQNIRRHIKKRTSRKLPRHQKQKCRIPDLKTGQSDRSPEMSSEPTVKREDDTECRLCLRSLMTDENLHSLLEPWKEPWDGMENTVADDLMRLTNIRINQTDMLSTTACSMCYCRLREASDFVKCVLRNDNVLKERSRTVHLNVSSESMWPQPISVDQNVAVDVKVKQEDMSDEEANISPQLGADMKIEPEEIQPQVNGTNTTSNDSSNNKVNCVFCGQETFEKTIKFTPDTLQKCLVVLEYRRTKPVQRKSRSNYSEVQISDVTSLDDSYHSQCYKLFTAIKIPRDFHKQQTNAAESAVDSQNVPEVSGEKPESPISSTSTTTQDDGTTTDEAGVTDNLDPDFEDSDDQFRANEPVCNDNLPVQKCFMCEKSRKQHSGRELPLAVNKYKTIELLKSAATEHTDKEMLEKISSFADTSKIPYHKFCKDQYLRNISKGGESDFVKKRKASNTAYIMLCEMLEEYVIKDNKCLFFDHVKQEYLKLLIEQTKLLSDSVVITSFTHRHLEKKLMDTFEKKIKIIYAEKRKFLAPFSIQFVTYKDLFKTYERIDSCSSSTTQRRNS